jgi:response regulator RpfG family c-di-GMP phosphodiesterase
MLAAEPVDLVVSDMRMPEMDGVQFLERVRERWPGVIRIMLTGYADIHSTVGAINRGEIHRYISKPWDDQDILLSVGDGLRRKQLEEDNRRLDQLTQDQNAELGRVNIQLEVAMLELQEVNKKLQSANEQLQEGNEVLEQRVKARTQDLLTANTQLGAANEQLGSANEQLGSANAGMAKANAQLGAANLQLEENFALSIGVFASLLELRDGGVAGHGHRVATLARRLAEKMKLSGVEVVDIYNAGLLHEVGKIGLPDELFGKPESLMSGAEFEVYKLHPLHAQTALMPLGRLRQSAIIIRSQHERIDGRGYPDGLSGFEVSLGAQIVSVTSMYESLIAGRLAEKEYSTEEAAQAIRVAAATRYDSEVIEAFELLLVELAAEALADIEVLSALLKPGMVLARAVLSPYGSVLLPVGYSFTTPVIKQVLGIEQRNSMQFVFFIKKPVVADKHRAPAKV